MENRIKIYGLCLDRLRHQIASLKQKTLEAAEVGEEVVLLESYNSGDVEDIIDILEIQDLRERNLNRLSEKLRELEYTLSALTGEAISFSFNDEGQLGLYLTLNDDNKFPSEKTFQNSTPITYCMRY